MWMVKREHTAGCGSTAAVCLTPRHTTVLQGISSINKTHLLPGPVHTSAHAVVTLLQTFLVSLALVTKQGLPNSPASVVMPCFALGSVNWLSLPSHMGHMRNAYQTVIGKTEGKRR
jgi:hypothetical protein